MTRRDILARAHAALATTTRPAALPRPVAHRVDADAGAATVWIYAEIGDWGVSAYQLVPELAALHVASIDVRLNSPGGDYFDGVAIGNALAEHPARVTMHVDGMAASAASVIAMAGDDIVMHPGAQLMIHDALTVTVGNAAEHRRTVDLLDSVSQDIAALYASRAGGTADSWRAAMLAETWYSGDQAVTAGLADRLVERESAEQGSQWAAALAEFRAAQAAPQPPAPPDPTAAPAALPTAGPTPTLSELLCSAFREEAVA